jgi:hypothetical protein
MASETTIRGIIDLKLRTGALPTAIAGRVWVGTGANEICSACDEKITKKHDLCEWEDGAGRIVMHGVCYKVWDEERRRTRPGRRTK